MTADTGFAPWVKTRGENHKAARDCRQAIASLYTDGRAARPGKGLDAKAAGWEAKLATPWPAARPAGCGRSLIE